MEKLGSIPHTPTLRVLAAQQDLAFCFFLSVVCDYRVVSVFACALFFLPLLSAATVGEGGRPGIYFFPCGAL